MSDPITTRSQVMKSLLAVLGDDAVDDHEVHAFMQEMERRGLRIVDVYDSGGALPPAKPKLSHMRSSPEAPPDAAPGEGAKEGP